MQKDNGGSNTYYTKKNINNIFLAILLIKLCPSMINLANQQFFTEEKMWSTGLLKRFLMSLSIVD